MKGSIFYDVILKKTFTYPKSMLERGAEIENAERNAAIEIEKVIHEIANNKFEQINIQQFFTFETKEKKGWKLREEPTQIRPVNINDVVDYLAQLDVEKKFGILNIEENPDLFECVIQDNAENWFLKPEIEDAFNKVRGQYKNKLKNFFIFNINPDDPTPVRRITNRNPTQGIYQRISNMRNSFVPASNQTRLTEAPVDINSTFATNYFGNLVGYPQITDNPSMEQSAASAENAMVAGNDLEFGINEENPLSSQSPTAFRAGLWDQLTGNSTIVNVPRGPIITNLRNMLENQLNSDVTGENIPNIPTNTTQNENNPNTNGFLQEYIR